MFEIEVNNRIIDANSGETILTAMNRAGIKVPTLCHMEGLVPSGACRICSVEVDGQRGLIPSCSYPVAEGMKIQTNSQRVIKARKTIIELLLADHPDDCLFCVRSGTCSLQDLSQIYGIRERHYSGKKSQYDIDVSSDSIVRDPAKCILCGKCVRVCEEVQGVGCIDFIGRGSKTVIAPPFENGLNASRCINCGQCIMVCPTGALREQSNLHLITDAINDPDKITVVCHAPSISVTLAEEFGLSSGTNVSSLMVSAFRKMGFDHVFDMSFGADLTIMEEAAELAGRLTNGGKLPMFTSCSPGWVKYVEQDWPEFMGNLSSCKSPQQMLGAVTKHYFAQKNGIDPKKIFMVSVIPCAAKKFEAKRPEMSKDGMADVDAAVSTRELARLIRMSGIDFNSLEPAMADQPFGKRSTAGKLFGATGGVMEAALRTAHFMITGKELKSLKIDAVRGTDKIKEAKIMIGDTEIGIAVANGLGNAKKLLQQIKDGRDDLHFVEVMTCPNGCIGGGGQPLNCDINKIKSRMQALYKIDQTESIRTCHENPAIKDLYNDFLEKPLGEKSHDLLHTKYTERKQL